MSLYFYYLQILFKSQMQYRTSFWLLSIGQFFIPFSVFAGLYFLFEQFGQIKGWQFFEVALCFAIIHMAFSISECFARGFDSFSNLVVNGDFDRLLVRPRSTVVQVLGSKFEFTRVGRLLQSIIVLIWALANLTIDWSIMKGLTLCFMVISGVLIFTGIYILAATLCFWTIQGLEVTNIFTDGGREMAQYPLNIYQKWIAKFFTYVIPFGTVNYIPLLYLLGKTDGNDLIFMFTPVLGCLFIIPCLLLWHKGVKYYRSTGS
ncbi:MAG TPA: ABC-2 family transporter protein [Bacillus sp. (in: firmicutes)]|uniref:ABC transporter permease n=1 Tax=Bacillus litorisediminis TaxID=2922713 RepID=UPI001FAFD030|nr:ABC-2 family transporter protein [Bacillus litorisediminis]HWO76657.1 ABC-2 family transporter protein [Bacillus sp. (in: firmicutes)]